MDKYKVVEEHYRTNYNKLKTVVCKYSKKPMHVSEDIVQNAYTRAINYIDSYDPSKGPFDKWFSLVVFNAMRTYITSERKHDEAVQTGFSLDTFQDVVTHDGWRSLPDELVFYQSEINEVKGDFIKAIEAQPAHKALILSLYFLEGFTSLDIAQMVGYSHDNVRYIISEFGKKLRQQS